VTDNPDAQEPKKKKWHKAVGRVAWSLAKGLSIPILAGALAWCVSYPLGMYQCRNYTLGLHLDGWNYTWFTCFLNEDGKWYTKEQYEASAVGVRLIISPDVKFPK